MDNMNYIMDEDFDSSNYHWNTPHQKKIKMFVVSTTMFHRKPFFNKVMQEYYDSGVEEDIDVYRMKHEYIVPNTREDSDVEYHTNKTKKQFISILDGLQTDKTLKDYDCYFFMFFTFSVEEVGKEGGKEVSEERLHFADGTLSIHEIWDRVKKVTFFHGKPKVFLIQSDNLKLLHPEQGVKSGPTDFEYERLSVDADRLIIQSTIPAQYAQKLDGDKASPSGSFLIQAFLEVMEENKKKPSESQLDLFSLTTAINNHVKKKIKELEERGEKYAKYLTFPQISSTFTKELYL